VPLPQAVGLVTRIRQYSWGALLGLAATGAAAVLVPSLKDRPWLDAPIAILCVAGGMLIERLVRYFIGRDFDLRLQHRNATREAERELEKLREYRRKGLISAAEAKKLAARIGKRDVLGSGWPGKPRGPYKKKAAPIPPPSAQGDPKPPQL
jgi:hypothetical protein